MDDARRWRPRRLAAALVGLTVLMLPGVAGIVAGLGISRTLPRPSTVWELVVEMSVVLLLSTAVLLLVDRQVRRLLPLATLLRLTLVFPDRAPSRFSVALRAGSSQKLRERLAHVSPDTLPDEPTPAAIEILTLASALNVHDPRTRGHSERVRALTDMIAEEMRLPTADRDRLRWASLLHDVGKLSIPTTTLNKAGRLDEDEWAQIHRHPHEGHLLTKPLHPFLGDWAATVEQHHERWDGTGYPNRLRGEAITPGARIVAVADAFEVMTHARSYKQAMSAAEARNELARCAGEHFDPRAVRAFLRISVGRLRWLTGPLAWIGQVPIVGRLAYSDFVPGMATAVKSGTAAAVVAGTAALATPAAIPLVAAALPPPPHVLGQVYERAGSVRAEELPTTTLAPTTTTVPLTTTTTRVRRPQRTTTTTKPAVTPSAGSSRLAEDDTATTSARKPVRIAVLANDHGRLNPKSLRVLSGPGVVEAGTPNANPNARGTVLYVPGPWVSGTDKFTYEVCDTAGRCGTATVTIVVTG